MFKRFTTAALIAAAASPAAFAANKLEEIVVTSSRIEMPLRQIGTSLSVVSAPEIKALGYSGVLDVLRTVPGIAASNSGGAGKDSALRIRGEEGFRTQVYIDGLKLSDPTGTQVGPNFAHILSAGIERVEILRGPQGLMYGADGGGLVNIFTGLADDGSNGELSAKVGAYGTREISLAGEAEYKDLKVFGMYTDLNVDGYNARPSDTTRDDDGYDNSTAHIRLNYSINDNIAVGAVLRDVEGEAQFDGCFGSQNCLSVYEQQAMRYFVDYSKDSFTSSLAFSRIDTDRDSLTAGVSTFSPEGTLDRIEYLGTLEVSSSLSLLLGADFETEDVKDDGSGASFERDQTGVFVEVQLSFGDNAFLTIGERLDDHDDFGSKNSHRVTGAYIIDLAADRVLKLKSSYSTGFRAPSISEQAYNNGAFAFGAAAGLALTEETSEGWEAGIEYSADNGTYVEIVYFDQTVEDEIFFDLVGFQGYFQANGDTETQGVELSYFIPLCDALALQGNYTYNDTETAAGAQRIRRPRHVANLGLRYTGMEERLQLSANVRAAKDSVDQIFGVGRVELDDYEVVDISARFQVVDNFQVFANVENLLGEDYIEVTDFNTSDSALYAGFTVTF